MVDEVESASARGGEINFYYGSALAQLGRWDEARTALLAGRRLQPTDERFPVELGASPSSRSAIAKLLDGCGSGSEVMTNALVNNVTNMTLLLGLPAIFWNMNLLPASKAKKKKRGGNREHEVNRLSLLLTLTFDEERTMNMLGAITGDIIGSPYEHNPIKSESSALVTLFYQNAA